MQQTNCKFEFSKGCLYSPAHIIKLFEFFRGESACIKIGNEHLDISVREFDTDKAEREQIKGFAALIQRIAADTGWDLAVTIAIPA